MLKDGQLYCHFLTIILLMNLVFLFQAQKNFLLFTNPNGLNNFRVVRDHSDSDLNFTFRYYYIRFLQHLRLKIFDRKANQCRYMGYPFIPILFLTDILVSYYSTVSPLTIKFLFIVFACIYYSFFILFETFAAFIFKRESQQPFLVASFYYLTPKSCFKRYYLTFLGIFSIGIPQLNFSYVNIFKLFVFFNCKFE